MQFYVISFMYPYKKSGRWQDVLDTQYAGSSKKMDVIWNRYNLKSTTRIYTFGVLKCSEKFKVLDLPQYISIRAPFVALETSKRNSISRHVFWIMSRVTVSMIDVILSCRCWIFLIFSAYTMFLMYPHRKKSSGERSGLRGGHMTHHRPERRPSVSRSPTCGSCVKDERLRCLTFRRQNFLLNFSTLCI